MTEPTFFAKPADFRKWLQRNHDKQSELIVGFYKKGTGKPSITWEQSVREALCFGWIDGVRRGVDADSYTIRFTPRKPQSIWSNVNVRIYSELVDEGKMTPAGEAAWSRRREDRTGVYSGEQGSVELPPEAEQALRAAAGAWEWWEAQPMSYRRPATWWLISAKKVETRQRRLAQLVEDCSAGRPIKPLRWGQGSKPKP